MPDIGKISN